MTLSETSIDISDLQFSFRGSVTDYINNVSIDDAVKQFVKSCLEAAGWDKNVRGVQLCQLVASKTIEAIYELEHGDS